MKTVRKVVNDVARLLVQPEGLVRPKQGDRRVRPVVNERLPGVGDRNWCIYQRYMQDQESLADIGSDLSLSRERIRHIVKAVEKRAV